MSADAPRTPGTASASSRANDSADTIGTLCHRTVPRALLSARVLDEDRA